MGCSRARIGQFAKILKIGEGDGINRRRCCTVKSLWIEWNNQEFCNLLRSKGFEVRPVMRNYYRGHSHFHLPYKKLFRVNGLIVMSCIMTNASNDYLQFKTPLTKAHVYIFNSKYGYWIIPKDRMPIKCTSFCTKPRLKSGDPSDYHDWMSFREAWHHLENRTDARTAMLQSSQAS